MPPRAYGRVGRRCHVAEYPLKTLLGLRRREEEAATEAWAGAQRVRQQAETEAERLHDATRAIEARLSAEQEAARSASSRPASEVTGTAWFVERLREEHARAMALRDAHRRGPLARARAEEERARQDLVERRRAREALETHDEQFRAGERRAADRRADEDNDEHARLARHGRGRSGEPQA